ncbi:MAG: DUF4062 domain-containing protein, partial [Chloroflexota bacterium]|nr:DUF4062 domain-containing protein [Chloroflexota bacterium]
MPENRDQPAVIRTPDQRLRVFVSSTLQELAPERKAAREAIDRLHLAPVMFELGARPHPPRQLYRAYLDQSHIFVGLYWQSYGWVAPGEEISGLEDEYNLSGDRPKLIYVKSPAPDRHPGLTRLLDRIRSDDRASYKSFSTPAQLRRLLVDDLILLLTERFEATAVAPDMPSEEEPAAQGLTGLPVPSTPLIGREAEVKAVSALMLQRDVRLVTLTGPGGVGKTRLALAVAETVRREYPDGVFWVPLAQLRDASLVPGAILQALGLMEQAGGPVSTLCAHLRDKQLMLLLDNFEQVVEAVSVVSQLLTASSGLK